MAVCPVCYMEMGAKKVRGTGTFTEQAYYFGSPACPKKFDRSPDDFIKK